MTQGGAIIWPNASFSGAKKIYAPAGNNLLAWHYTRNNNEDAQNNWAPQRSDGVIVGSPGYVGAYMEADGLVDFLETSATETDDFTWMVAAANNDTIAGTTTDPAFMGNYNGSNGSSFYSQANGSLPQGQLNAQSYVDASNKIRNLVITDFSAFRMYALVMDSVAGTLVLHDLSGAASDNTPTFSPGARNKNSQVIRVGSAYGAFAGNCKIAFAGIWSRALSSGEMAEVKRIVTKDLAAQDTPITLP